MYNKLEHTIQNNPGKKEFNFKIGGEKKCYVERFPNVFHNFSRKNNIKGQSQKKIKHLERE